MKNTKKKESLIMVGARIPAPLEAAIRQKAETEERSLSQIISRLLASHPELKAKKSLALQS